MASTFTTNLNLEKPEAGSVIWKGAEDNTKEAIDDIGNLFVLSVGSPFVPAAGDTFFDGWIPQENVTLKKIGLFAQVPPAGQALIVEVLKNGIAQPATATLTAGLTWQNNVLPTALDFTNGERLGLRYSQVGSVDEGNGILVTLYFMKQAIP